MKLLLLILLFIKLFADSCQDDKREITLYYTKAKRLYYKKSYSEAINYYQKSENSANKALQSCQNQENFDFNMMYNYIVESENRIDEINFFMVK